MRGLRVVALVALTLSPAAEGASFGTPDMAVRRVADAAAKSMASPACLAVLPALGGPVVSEAEAVARLAVLRFEDGAEHTECRTGRAFALTTVGGNTVWLCAGPLRTLEERNRHLARAIVIHELFHTLGLAEAPTPGAPTSRTITAAVMGACR